jgi:hypothetical protein
LKAAINLARQSGISKTSSFGNRTFLALNDSNAGFAASTDAILEITGFSGNLDNLQVFSNSLLQ